MERFFNILIAYFLRWCHLMTHLLGLDPENMEIHQAYTEGKSIQLFGIIEIWFIPTKISCICGECWYFKE
jgi:hypothetical protein